MAEDWEIVLVVDSVEEAELIAGFLTSRGVDCQVESSLATEFPTTVGALGVVRLEVPSSQLAEAQRLLADRERADAGLPEGTLVDEEAAGGGETV